MRYYEIINEEELDEWADGFLSGLKQKESFNSWFGNSKVVNKDGSPMPVFHYTKNDFDLGEIYHLSHFGTSKAAFARWQYTYNLGSKLGRIPKKRLNDLSHENEVHYWGREYAQHTHQTLPVFLKIENPLRITDEGENHTPFTLYSTLYKMDITQLSSSELDNDISADTVIEVMKKNGYDGFSYRNSEEHKGSLSWIILEPSQVRSVFDFD